ncbi:Mur ligase family protein [Cumulibacter soli]|uniref:Mur ligase family protein n=1 Tax=Cumulibacter soli TaxID=2546344 RepID=UPI001068A6F9|nr:MurT ligase domain-containing protein [Cumulibacter soli]
MTRRPAQRISLRGQLGLRAARAASWASQKAGRGKGAMIGGLIALKIDPTLMGQLGAGRRTALITGTNGKSTTTRMTAAALATVDNVVTQSDGANMDAGIVAALATDRSAPLAAIEVDELHLPHVADALKPEVIVLLNLSRDQLDRVGEINAIERKIRQGLARHPNAVIVANCDDVLISSAAYDAPNVVWVSAGSGWGLDATSCPRSGEPILWDQSVAAVGGTHWHSSGAEFSRPTPQWWLDGEYLCGPGGQRLEMTLTLPGQANRGNAAQAVAAAVAMGAKAEDALAAAASVGEVAGRYRTVQVGAHSVRMLLAKNPAGWQEALSMVDTSADGIVISVNGQVPDGEDLSWLWDVKFSDFDGRPVIAAGERGTDLAVRLTYADVEHTLIADTLRAIEACPPGRVEVLANYTAFRDLNRALEAR